MDLVSYNNKHNNQSWPFGPSDGGTDDNLSWDSGNDRALRRQRLRSFMATQMFSRGVPLTVGGDEFGRTQNGNNNPYKIDSIAMWQNYAMIGTTAPTAVATEGSGTYHDNYGDDGHPSGKNGLFQFIRFLLGMRKAHPCLRQDRFGDFSLDHGDDVTYWFKREDGFSDLREGDRAVHWRIDGSAIGDLDFLLCMNMRHLEAEFALPPVRPGKSWRRIVDTASWAETHGNFWELSEAESIRDSYRVDPYSILVLVEA
jgi:glycogen operon protein